MDTDENKSFSKEYADAIKARMLAKARGEERDAGTEALRNWRAWGSWFSWGSPVGLGLFLIAIGAFLVLLHYAGLIG
ncbi:MAG: hypothetical protein KGI69_01210 [Patescibacteria group bacterium]|nr:hypothetical protein [Patescibacteria group bacterium]